MDTLSIPDPPNKSDTAATPAPPSDPPPPAAPIPPPGTNGTPTPPPSANAEPPGSVGRRRPFALHLADLQKSGLSDEQIAKCGFHSWDAKKDASLITVALNWRQPYDGRYGDALVIPYRERKGRFTNYCRLKFDKPKIETKDGKKRPRKYKAPYGEGNRAYFPPGTLAALNDPTVPLLITEGEKKAAKADQEGFPTISISGVWNWQKKRLRNAEGAAEGSRELIDDLASIPWQGRLVYIVFDYDEPPNPDVLRAAWHLARALTERGAVVKIVTLPAGPNDTDGKPTKCGLDDFFVAGHTADKLRQLIAAATHPEEPPPTLQEDREKRRKKKVVLEDPDDPNLLARLFAVQLYSPPAQFYDLRINRATLTLRYWLEEWYLFAWGAYQPVPEKDVRSRLSKAIKIEFDRLNIEEQLRFEDKAASAAKEKENKAKAKEKEPKNENE